MDNSIFPKYIMATILMPIEVKNLEEDDYVCLQERARVSLSFCQELPEIAKEGEGYGGLSDKIKNLYHSYDKNSEEIVGKTEEKKEEKGAIEISDGMIKSKEKRNKKNITYRSFRENEKSHRYTFRHWG